MIRVFCICGRAFKTEDRHAGKSTKCPVCGADVTIGPVPESSSSGGDGDGAPGGGYPSDPLALTARGMVQTRSGSDPGPDAVNTMVLPEGYDPRADSQTSSQPTPAAAQANAQPPPWKATLGSQVQVPGIPTVPVNKVWLISGGAIAFLALAVGVIIAFRSGSPAVNAVSSAPREGQSGKPDGSEPIGFSSPAVPAQNPASSENTHAKTLTGDASAGSSPSRREADVNGQPKAALAHAPDGSRLLVPAYIYPTGDGRKEWQRLCDAASKVEIVAIVNPSSGPGGERNLDYAAIFSEASDQGIKLVGYVSTDYGERPQPEIKNEVDAWIRLYPQIRGFFFDQQSRDRQHAAKFVELRDYAKQKLRDALVITNPGVSCDEAYFAQGVSDLTCVFVNFEGFDRFELPAPLKAYDPARFAAMPYNIPDVQAMRTALKDAIIKRIGYIYISDAKPPVLWGRLPAYWEAEVDAVSRLR